MPKSIEKEPLLFVDTMYKGCHVNEQSFFKTPTPKPKDIKAENYVHNFDQLSESNFKPLIPSNVTIHEVVEDSPNKDIFDEEITGLEEDCPYEIVNIVVDYLDNPSFQPFEEINEDSSLQVEGLDDLESISVIENQEINEDIQVSYEDETSLEEIEESVPYEEAKEITSDEISSFQELDEKQQEILLFIKDLTNRPSMMKAPIVQIVQKDGQLKSGMIQVVDDRHISVDDLMDHIETISVIDIERIRILHL